MGHGENGVTGRSSTRARETLIDAGALIPARRPQNVLDIVARPAPEGSRPLTDILLEMRPDGRDERQSAFGAERAALLDEATSPAAMDEDWDQTAADGID